MKPDKQIDGAVILALGSLLRALVVWEYPRRRIAVELTTWMAFDLSERRLAV